jgi:hypothetical protein
MYLFPAALSLHKLHVYAAYVTSLRNARLLLATVLLNSNSAAALSLFGCCAAADDMLKGQLPTLAAAHPEAYSALVDCFLRSPVLDAFYMLSAADVFAHPLAAVLSRKELLSSSVAVASAASALTSLVKRTVQCVIAATRMQQDAPQAVDVLRIEHVAAACYPATLFPLLRSILCPSALRLQKAAIAISQTSSSRGSNQAAASAACLATLLVRSLLQLADAMEAAGPQLLFRALAAKPCYPMTWAPGGVEHSIELVDAVPCGNAAQHTEDLQWQFWQLAVLPTFQPLLFGLRVLGVASMPGDGRFASCGGSSRA